MARRLVEVDVDAHHEVERRRARGRAAPQSGVDSTGLPATVISARIWPSPGVSISSARHTTGQLAVDLGQAAHPRACAARTARRGPCRGVPPVLALPVGGLGEHRAAGPVEVAGEHVSTSTSHDASVPNSCVHVPMRPYTAARRRGRELAREAADRRRRRCRITGRDALGRERRAASAATSSTPVDVTRRAAPRSTRSLGEQHVHDREQEERVGAGPDDEVLVGLLRRLRCGAGRRRRACRRARAAPQPAGQVGRGPEAAVRRERVGAEHQQVVGAVDVGDRDDERGRRTSDPADTCFGIWSTVLAV